MKIGIDISQLAFSNTGVANYLQNLVMEMVKNEKHEYILFYSSLRRNVPEEVAKLALRKNVVVKKYKFPPTALHLLFNIVHLTPIENLLGRLMFSLLPIGLSPR